MMVFMVFYFCSEIKFFEYRFVFIFIIIVVFIKVGYVVNVECFLERIFDDSEFEVVGVIFVFEGSWEEVFKEYIIVGFKEFEEKECKCFYNINLIL